LCQTCQSGFLIILGISQYFSTAEYNISIVSFLVQYLIYFSEMVSEYAVGNCQRQDFGLIKKAPKDKSPVIEAAFIDYSDV
jgi:hypothetical protein